MKTSTNKTIFKISFVNQGKVYELYAKTVAQSNMLGFVEVEGLLFGEKTAVVIDPSEERLKQEFTDVERTYVPINSIIRIDEVEKKGTSKIIPITGKGDNTLAFPTPASFLPTDKKE